MYQKVVLVDQQLFVSTGVGDEIQPFPICSFLFKFVRGNQSRVVATILGRIQSDRGIVAWPQNQNQNQRTGGKGDSRGKGKGKGDGKGKKRPAEEETEQDRDEKLAKIQCFKCGKMGHYADKCPESDSTAAGDAPAAGFKQASFAKGKGKGKGRGKGKGKNKPDPAEATA